MPDNRPKLTRAEAFEKMRHIVASKEGMSQNSITEDKPISENIADAIFEDMMAEKWYPHHGFGISVTADYTIGKMLDQLDFP